MVDETRELDSCDNGTRLPHGALVWFGLVALHERDGLMDPCAVFEGTGRTCARGDRCPFVRSIVLHVSDF